MKRSMIGFAAAAVVAGNFLIAAPAFSQTQVSIIVQNAPPAARYEPVPAPRRGFVWAPGFWNWNGRGYVWEKGHWEHERSGYVYQRPEWRQNGNGWNLHHGGWAKREHIQARADQDHDGIPNRADRDRDGDGVPNRVDRDRDGDGIPNRHDDHPDNPYRR